MSLFEQFYYTTVRRGQLEQRISGVSSYSEIDARGRLVLLINVSEVKSTFRHTSAQCSSSSWCLSFRERNSDSGTLVQMMVESSLLNFILDETCCEHAGRVDFDVQEA